MTESRIETIFCDDIREEVGNKRSLMGIYHGEMFVQNFPVLLPRLCFYVTLVRDIDTQADKVEIKVVKGTEEEEILSTGVIEFPELSTNENNLGIPYSNQTLVLAFGISPFSIELETVIRVVAQMGENKILGPCLRVRSADNLTTAQPA